MNKQKLKWVTVTRKVSDLLPNERNPRVMNSKQDEDLTKSINKFDLVEIPVIDLDGRIIAGHQRVRKLKEMGRGNEKIEVRIPNRKLSKKEYDQYLLISNRVRGDFDWDKLLEDYDVATLLESGFDNDLSNILDDTLEVEDDEFSEKNIKEALDTDIKVGDMFQLGMHTLICSDSTDPETVKKLVGKEKIDLINIDYPYNLGVDYSAGLGGGQNYGGKTNDKKSEAEYRKFVKDILQNALSVSNNSCHIFTWLDEKFLGLFQEIFKEVGIEFKRLCLWAKGPINPTPQIAFNRAVELCMYSVKNKPYLSDKIKNLDEFLNKEISTGNRSLDDLMDIFQIWISKKLPGNQYLHPTMKPPSLYEKSLRRCSKVGSNVLDLCAGSGSLMVACQSLKRRGFFAEIEPVFTQVIINRFKQLAPNEKVTKLN